MQTTLPPLPGNRPLRRTRVLLAALVLASAAGVAAHGLENRTLWSPFEPRVAEIAREQYAAGDPLRPLTLAGMPFLEQPPLYYDLVALAFRAAGGPSVPAGRIVTALLCLLWLLATFRTASRAAGPRAGLLAAAFLAASPIFLRLSRRIQVDVGFAAMLATAFLFLFRAVSAPGDRVRRWPFFLAMLFVGLGSLAKGVLAHALFLPPLAAYALLARDARPLRALLHPLSLLFLFGPLVGWGALLYAAGGKAFVYEHFVNNSLGRFLHIRFDLPGIRNLPYGDVNSPRRWSYYVDNLPLMAAPAVLGAIPAAVHAFRGRGRPASRRRTLERLSLCFGLVPAMMLTFSSQKGVQHLGAPITAVILLGTMGFDRWLRRRRGTESSRGVPAAAAGALLAAPLCAVAGAAGLLDGRDAVLVVGGAVVLVGLAAVVPAAVAGRRRLALHSLLAVVAASIVLDFAPGVNRETAAARSQDAFAVWLAAEAGDAPVAVDRFGDNDLGAFSFFLRRPVLPLFGDADLAAFLDRSDPGLAVLCQPGDERVREVLAANPRAIVFADGGHPDRRFVVLAGPAAAARFPAPRCPPPAGLPGPRVE